MSGIARRIAFAEKFVTDKQGRKFSLEGRDWVVENMWAPLEGYKLWPGSNTNSMCEDCKDKIGTIVESHKPVECGKCGGKLTPEPIVCTVLCLPRRAGKTFNATAYCLSSIFQRKHKSISYVAASEDQTSALAADNFIGAVQRNPTLSRSAKISGNLIRVPKTESKWEGLSTSFKSITGRGRSLIVIDEARDIAARVAMSVIPSVFEAGGVECLRGHYHTEKITEEISVCPLCGDDLIPWRGRILIMSAAGVLEGGEGDWFKSLVERLETKPHKNFHMFRADNQKALNPQIDKATVDAIEGVFGDLDETRHYVEVEIGNEFTRKGEDFVTKAEIERVVDKSLKNKVGSERPCVGFLDTSVSRDLTTLLILAEDESSVNRWENVRVEHIKVWEPKKQPDGVIDPEAVLEYLRQNLPMFPGMVDLRIDTRAMPWAIKMVKQIKRKEPWARVVDGYNGNRSERASSWNILEQRIRACTLKMPDNETLQKELLSVRRLLTLDGIIEIRDRDRKRRHADIADALATSCFLAHLQAIKGRVSLQELNGRASMVDLLDRLHSTPIDKFNPDSF